MGQVFNHNGPQLGAREIARLLTRARGEEVAAGGRGSSARASGSASPREVLMGARWLTAVFGMSFLLTFGPSTADGGEPKLTIMSAGEAAIAAVDLSPSTSAGVQPAAFVAEPVRIEPWIQERMPPKVEEKLRAALDLAGRRIRESPECGELFTELGAHGIETLRTTFYFPVLSYKAGLTSCRKALAFTYVGEAPTYLCSGFSRLSDERAAVVIVHEALHHAGLTEKPLDPKGMTSRAINVMVKKSCGF